MSGYLRRLATTGAAYTAASIFSKLIAVALLPLYTAYLTTGDYGGAEILFASVVSVSIVVRFGLIEALLRFYYKDEENPREVVASTFAGLFWFSTLAVAVALPFAGPISEALFDERARGELEGQAPELVRIAIAGLWVLTMFEFMLTLFRLEERARAYFVTTILNVLATIAVTIVLVVGADEGARGLLLGSYATGAAFVLGLIALHWRQLSLLLDLALLRRLLRFGLPTMPAEVSLYLLNFVDRIIIVRSVGLAEAGLYSLAVKFAQAVNVLVRGFQLAWPPLAYSIRDDDEARRAYAIVMTLFVAGCAFVVAGMWLFSRWIVRVLATPEFFDSCEAVGLISTAVTLYAHLHGDGGDPRPDRPHRVQLPRRDRRPGRQRRPQPDPGAFAGDRRRRDRAGRLLRRRGGPDVRLHPAPLPGPLPVGPARPRRPRRRRPGRPRRAADADRRRPRPARPRRSVRRSIPWPTRDRLLHPRGAPLARAAAPPAARSRPSSNACAKPRRPSTAASPRPTRSSEWTRTAGSASGGRAIFRSRFAALGPQCLAGVGAVDVGGLAGQDEGGERPQAVGPGGERAHRAGGAGAVVLAHVEVAVAVELDDPRQAGGEVGGELLVVDGARPGHVEECQPASARRLPKSVSSE